MARELSTYHRRIAASNRAAILRAAASLFLGSGYDRTSLAQVAADAGVSKATLFKQFPTKAELFEATVLAEGEAAIGEIPVPPPGDLHAGLVALGRSYVELLTRPRVEALMRTLIAESGRFPELRERTFDFGTLSVVAAVRRHFETESLRTGAQVGDLDIAATQFLGMIATVVFWPRLIHGGWSLSAGETERVVEEAARTIVARFGGQ
ncbi:TetR family transcriptional regulator [Brevibacterium sanguinis]|uniref:TetR family transcriptional regulator n=2 Tax=Brevibacterium TaxID=1696 RepID=A0A366IQB0_9MICO|nr:MULTISPECIES: TetR/AcrR family transcriptional regulator [Brevibacterium]RBP61712.1 TetR family transcriptional regulator [Brevibacterium sanguinis]RBP74307.1 TetR family transcriptional regulator [Brevibacterium celere]